MGILPALKRILRERLPYALTVLLLAGGLGACDALAPGAGHSALTTDGPNGSFNPQPDPPLEILWFSIDTPELSGDPTRMRWVGTLADGSVNVLTEAAQFRGATLHLAQTWTLLQGENSRVVSLSGIFNTQSGRLVLNGEGARVQGSYSPSGVGGVLGGELMFNPQPDPPLEG